MAKKLKLNRALFVIIILKFYIPCFIYRIKPKICLIITYINLNIGIKMDLISYIFALKNKLKKAL